MMTNRREKQIKIERLLIKHTAVFISHGGMNSTMEALWFGVPQIVIPRQPETALTARNLERLQLGISLSPEQISTERLREAVNQLLHDHALHERLQAMQESVRTAGGYEKSADTLQAYFAAEGTTPRVLQQIL